MKTRTFDLNPKENGSCFFMCTGQNYCYSKIEIKHKISGFYL